jgi:cysteine desulfurase family protein (TIGR01976 family)
LTRIRRRFPSLRQKVDGQHPVYLDNPGGTQVPAGVMDAMRRYLVEANSNSHGAFRTSELTDQTIESARAAMADLFNAPSPREIVFGANMTTLTFHISRAIGQTLNRGDEIIVTRMDHDANIAPWLLVARDRGLTVRWVDFDTDTGLLNLDQMESLLSTKTKLVACAYASNALGTINNVVKVVEMAHAVGAMTYIDAVHYAPHGPIDVQALGCDFLVCSAYKFFGPHVGILYGRQEHLMRLPAYKVRPAPDQIPERWETGTLNHEGLAGVTAAVEYLDWIGTQFGEPFNALVRGLRGRRRRLKLAMLAIQNYERTLSRHLIDGLSAIEGVNITGITDPALFHQRAPTVIFSVRGKSPRQVAGALGKAGIYVWDGNYYALAVMETLGREEHGGMVRVGAVHYNTHREIDRFLAALEQVVGERLKVVGAKTAASKSRKKPDSPPDILA